MSPLALVVAPASTLDVPVVRHDDSQQPGRAAVPTLRVRGGVVTAVLVAGDLGRALRKMILVRVIRQFGKREPLVLLEKDLALTIPPTVGTALNLSGDGGPASIRIVAVTLNPRPDGPGLLPPGAVLFLAHEPRTAAGTARAAG